MREKTMKRGHLLLTLLAFVCLMGLGTIHANAATVKAKVDVKKFYGIAEQVLQEINRQRRNNGLSDLKMDANLTEAAMNIALQRQGGNADISNPEINSKGLNKRGGYDLYDASDYDNNLWKETANAKKAALKEVVEDAVDIFGDYHSASKIGIGIIATRQEKNTPVSLGPTFYRNATYCFVYNDIYNDKTEYKPYTTVSKTVQTQMILYINPSDTFLCISGKDKPTPKMAYDVIIKGETRVLSPGVWQNPQAGRDPYQELKGYRCKLSNNGAVWGSSDYSIVSVDNNGNVTAKKYGIATITLKIGTMSVTRKYVVADGIGTDTDTMLKLPKWNSKSNIPSSYTGNCYADGYALEVKNGRITWSKNMKTNKITRPKNKKGSTKMKKIRGGYYKIASKTKKIAQYVKPVGKNITYVSVPSIVNINGKRYKVTGIAANAFKNCKRLKKVTIGTNVRSIGKKAFYGCSKLQMIKIKTSKLANNRVGQQAFKKIYKQAVFKVPKKQLKSYKKLLKNKGIGKKVKIKK